MLLKNINLLNRSKLNKLKLTILNVAIYRVEGKIPYSDLIILSEFCRVNRK